jgi:hypothetical protein
VGDFVSIMTITLSDSAERTPADAVAQAPASAPGYPGLTPRPVLVFCSVRTWRKHQKNERSSRSSSSGVT